MSKHSALINKLWQSESDRKIARAFAEKFDVPGMEDRIPALLQEAAASADKVAAGQLSIEDARSYLGSFAAEGLGVAPHQLADLTTWFDGAGAEVAAAETSPQAEQAQAQPTQPAQPAPAAARIAEIDVMMRAPHGSDTWKAYWMGDAGAKVQAEYRDLITARETPAVAAPPAEPAPAP